MEELHLHIGRDYLFLIEYAQILIMKFDSGDIVSCKYYSQ